MARKSSKKPPEVLTVLVADAVTMWEKLAWDVDQYQDIQRSHPKERQPLAFAAINVCIAAWSLEQWAKTAWIQKERLKTETETDASFYSIVRQHVPSQGICVDIANTAKHARHRDDSWEGGAVRLEWQDGDEDAPPTFLLIHVHASGAESILAYNTFEEVRNHWWTCLVALGLATGPQYSPEFLQNKLRRIFGDRTYDLPDGATPVADE